MRYAVGAYGVKDLFTLVNLMGGVLGIYLAINGQPILAGYALIAGFLFGDSLDGQVARATKTGNRFGSEFDSASDGITQGLAPAIIVYVAYQQAGHQTLGFVLMSILVASGTIRQARFAVEEFNFPLCYMGLPRTVSGFLAMAYANSQFFLPKGLGYWGGVLVVGVVALLNLVPVPYMGHKGRKLQWDVKLYVAIFILSLPVSFIFFRKYFYDVLFFPSFAYACLGWLRVWPEEKKAFYDEYRRWAQIIASKK